MRTVCFLFDNHLGIGIVGSYVHLATIVVVAVLVNVATLATLGFAASHSRHDSLFAFAVVLRSAGGHGDVFQQRSLVTLVVLF